MYEYTIKYDHFSVTIAFGGEIQKEWILTCLL